MRPCTFRSVAPPLSGRISTGQLHFYSQAWTGKLGGKGRCTVGRVGTEDQVVQVGLDRQLGVAQEGVCGESTKCAELWADRTPPCHPIESSAPRHTQDKRPMSDVDPLRWSTHTHTSPPFTLLRSGRPGHAHRTPSASVKCVVACAAGPCSWETKWHVRRHSVHSVRPSLRQGFARSVNLARVVRRRTKATLGMSFAEETQAPQ